MFLATISLLCGWDRYEGNPVLGPVMPWAWMALSDPSLIALPEGGFYMVYTAAGLDTATGETLTRPGAAWSDDGFSWTMSEWTVISSGIPGSWDSAAVETPAIVPDGDSILLYYAGERAHGGGQLAIGLAVSYDSGLSYERVGDGPIITKDTSRWEEFRSIESPTVIRMGDSLIMWFNGQSLEWKINVCRAASFDGVNWFRHHDNPVLQTGGTGEFDEWGVYAPCVRAVGDSLIMIYNGFMMGTTTYLFDSTFLGYAVSNDKGVTWTKSPENPILGPGLISEWDHTGPKTPTFDIQHGELVGCYWNGYDGRLGIFTHSIASVEDCQTPPEFFSIHTYPNPFNSSIRITIKGKFKSPPRIEIYDIAGRQLSEFAETIKARSATPERGIDASSTEQEYVWHPNETLPSGIYLIRILMTDRSVTKRLVYLR